MPMRWTGGSSSEVSWCGACFCLRISILSEYNLVLSESRFGLMSTPFLFRLENFGCNTFAGTRPGREGSCDQLGTCNFSIHSSDCWKSCSDNLIVLLSTRSVRTLAKMAVGCTISRKRQNCGIKSNQRGLDGCSTASVSVHWI